MGASRTLDLHDLFDILVMPSSGSLVRSIDEGGFDVQARGGVRYEVAAIRSLMSDFRISIDKDCVRGDGEALFSYMRRLRGRRTPSSSRVILAQPMPLLALKGEALRRTIVVIHHVNEWGEKGLSQMILNRIILSKLKRIFCVVVVSEYWEQYLRARGVERLKRIYNFVEAVNRSFTGEDLLAFRRRYGLPFDKPIIYLGPALPLKGAREAFESLREKDYYFVVTGRNNQIGDVPVRFLSLDDDEYLRLLATADVLVSFSRMAEGWNRVAHEAMALGTPVVGGESGGMTELLKGGQQPIVQHQEEITEAVAYCLTNQVEIGANGRAFAEQHTYENFATDWRTLITEAIEAIDISRVNFRN